MSANKDNVIRGRFTKIAWHERGSETIEKSHAEYLSARVESATYRKKMPLRSTDRGLLFLYPRPDGTILQDFGRIRLMPEQPDRKFQQPADSGNFFYFAPLLKGSWERVCADVSQEIVMAEGECKAAALGQHGYASIAFAGIWNWLHRPHENAASEPIPDFDLVQWKGRKVTIVPDSDVWGRFDLQAAIIRLAAHVRRLGAKVVLRIPPNRKGQKQGVDDLIVRKGIKAFRALTEHTLTDGRFDSWGLNKEPKDTDEGNALRFVLRNGDRVRYVCEWRGWIVDDGVSWRRDTRDRIYTAARETVTAIGREALEAADERRAKLYRWAAESESNARTQAMIDRAAKFEEIKVNADELDRHPMLFTTASGVVDLSNGELIGHDPSLLLTKRTPVPFDAGATCPRFENFIAEVMGGDDEMVAYMRRVVGYLLTGRTDEHVFFVFYGTGSNGKSTFLRVLNELLGDFATSTRMESWIAQQRNAGGPSEDIARLAGARMASAIESEFGQRLAESQVKELTGGDKVTARRLHEGSFEFVPQFKLIFVCNHLPVIHGGDHAIWRRVHLVPFDQTFARKGDEDLLARLRAELPGILQWALKGAVLWQKHGLSPPEKVLKAVTRYRSDSDVFGLFIKECCELGEGLSVTGDAIYIEYRRWTERNGQKAMTNKSFGQVMQERKYTKKRGKKGVRYLGLTIVRASK